MNLRRSASDPAWTRSGCHDARGRCPPPPHAAPDFGEIVRIAKSVVQQGAVRLEEDLPHPLKSRRRLELPGRVDPGADHLRASSLPDGTDWSADGRRLLDACPKWARRPPGTRCRLRRCLGFDSLVRRFDGLVEPGQLPEHDGKLHPRCSPSPLRPQMALRPDTPAVQQ